MVLNLLLNGMILQVGAHLSRKLRTIAAVEVSTGRSDAAADAAAAWRRQGWVGLLYCNPIASMYGIFPYIWLICMVNTYIVYTWMVYGKDSYISCRFCSSFSSVF